MPELLKKGNSYTLIDEAIQEEELELYYSHQPEEPQEWQAIGRVPRPFIFEVTSPLRIYVKYERQGKRQIISTRNVYLSGSFNTRDLGGYQGAAGKTVKWGKLFRSDALDKVTAEDLQILSSMEIKTLVDFRSQRECAQSPDRLPEGVDYLNLSPNAPIATLASSSLVEDRDKVTKLVKLTATEAGIAELRAKMNEMSEQMRDLVRNPYANRQYRAYFRLLLEDQAPLLHHCKGGKDRTGFAAILILAALGVSKEEIKFDYMLTKENMAARNEKRLAEYQQFTDNSWVLSYLSNLMQTEERYIEAAYDEIEKVAGSMTGYLEDVMGLTEQKLARLRALYLVE